MYFDDDTLLDKIEDYLRGKLPAAEAADLDRQMAADPELAETVAAMRALQEGIEFSFQKELREKLEAWEQASPLSELAATSPPRSLPKWVWVVAALLAVLVGGGIWRFYADPVDSRQETPVPKAEEKPSPAPSALPEKQPAPPAETKPTQIKVKPLPKKQPAAPIESAAAQPSPSGAGEYARSAFLEEEKEREEESRNGAASASDTSLLGQAKRAFAVPDYPGAVAILQKIRPEDAQDEEAQELLGRAFFHQKNYGEAARTFKSMLAQGYIKETKQRAEWYWLLCLLQDYPANKSEVDRRLQEMLNPATPHIYLDKAQKLKAKMGL